MEQQTSAGDFKKNVLLLKSGDVTKRGDRVLTPPLNTLSQLRKTEQFMRDVVFSRNMSAIDVRKKLVEAFPALENKRFSCGKRANRESADLDFKGDRRVWDGATVKRLPGSSAMYIVVEDETSQVQGAANQTDCLTDGQHASSYTPPDLEGVNPGRFDVEALWKDLEDVISEDYKNSDGLRSCQNQTIQTVSGREISETSEPNRIDVNTGEISETGYSSGANSIPAQGLCQETAVTTGVTRNSFRIYQTRETACSSDEASSTQGQGLFQETAVVTATRNPSRLFHGCGTADSSDEGSSSKEQTFNVEMNPKSGLPEGGNRCFLLEFKNSLPSSVTSGWATFGAYGSVEVRRISDDDFTMVGKEIPRGRPGVVTVTITTGSGFYLGKALFTYEDPENETKQQVLCNKRKLEELSGIVQNLTKMFKHQGLVSQEGQVEPQNILKALVYAAAEAGALKLIETIFSLSAGRVAFQGYKEDIYLPEDIAEENGHRDVAAYLRATTKRHSEEYDISTDQSRSVAFDWTELANALEDIELNQSVTKPSSDEDLNQIWEDDIGETGYSADGETSSSGSEKENSDSNVEFVKMSDCRESRDDEKQQQPIVLVGKNPLESPDKSSYCSQWLADCDKGKLLIETPWHSTNSLKGKGDSAHKNTADFPPALTLERPMKSDLPNTFKPWDEVHLPVDILLLTVEDSEFLACFAFLRNAVKSYFKNLGYVYFGNMGESGDVPLKVALMTCSEGSSSPHGSLVTVQNAIVELRPKAAFYVGYSVDTSLQLGDVVVSSKLTADSLKTLVGRDILRPVRHADRGWIPPVKRPEDHKVQVCRDGDILSGINPISVKQQNMSHFTEATAYEIGCEDPKRVTQLPAAIQNNETLPDPRNVVVTELQLSDISDDVGTCWREVGPKLLIKASKIHNLDDDYKSNRDKANALLILWKEQEGSNATVGHLADVLEKIGRRSIAERLLGEGNGSLPTCETVSDGEEIGLTVKCNLKTESDGKLMLCEDTHGNKFLVKAINNCDRPWNSEEVQKNKEFLEKVAAAAKEMGKTVQQRRQESLKRISSEVQELRKQLKRVKLDSSDAESCAGSGDFKQITQPLKNDQNDVKMSSQDVTHLLHSCEEQHTFCQSIYNTLIQLIGEVAQLGEDKFMCIKQLYDFTKELKEQEKTFLPKIEVLRDLKEQLDSLQVAQLEELEKWSRAQKEQVQGVEKLLLSLLHQGKSQKILKRRSVPVIGAKPPLVRRRTKTDSSKSASKSQSLSELPGADKKFVISGPVCVQQLHCLDSDKKLSNKKT